MSVTEIADFQKYVCMDCGRLAKAKDMLISDGMMASAACPRCESTNVRTYVEADHEQVEVHAPPEGWEHPMEQRARELFSRVSELTGWREAKVRLFFETPNPMLGGVSPEWMIMHGRAHRLDRFIYEAEQEAAWYSAMAEGAPDTDG